MIHPSATTGSTASASLASGAAAPQLRGDSLSFLETIGQSVANIAPTGTPALTIAVVAATAGVGSWLAFLVATIGMMFVAGSIGTLAKRHPLAGSYFVYIGRTLGPLAGMIAGWSMIAAYTAAAMATVFAAKIFLDNILSILGLGTLIPPAWAFDLVFIGLVWGLAYRDIRISSRVGVTLEFLSLGIIAVITAIVVIRHGNIVDPAQLNVTSLDAGGVMSALAIAVFSFVGFESAATLAKELRNPTRIIPLAVTLSAGAAGLFFVVIAYAMVLGVDGQASVIGESSSPFSEITTRAGLAWTAGVVYFSALISMFACALACLNAVSRMMFSMGRYRFLHRSMGAVHERHQTPHLAISTAAMLTAIVCLLMMSLAAIDAFGYLATFSAFGFIVVYLLISIVAPIDLYRAGVMRVHHVAVGAIGVLLMGFVMFGSLFPVPNYPYNLLPYLFAGYLVAGALCYGILASRAPHALLAMQHDLEMQEEI